MTNEITPAYFDKGYYENAGEKSPLHAGWTEWMAPLIAKLVVHSKNKICRHGGKQVLEVGCAKGEVVKSLNDLGLFSYGIEYSEYAIQRSILPERCWQGDLSAESSDAYYPAYSVIHSWEVFEHIPTERIPTLLKNVYSLLHTGGMFIGSICLDKDQEKVEEMLAKLSPAEAEKRRDISHVTIKSREWWLEKFREVKFEVLEDERKDIQSTLFPLDNDLDVHYFSLHGKFEYSLFVMRKR